MDGMGDMGGMGGMDGMGSMDPTSHSCKISMLWNWDTIDACFLAESWQVRTRGGFAGLCIGVILLVITLEFVRRATRQYDRYILARHYHDQKAAMCACQNAAAGLPGGGSKEEEESQLPQVTAATATATATAASETSFRPSVAQQGVRALLHTMQFALSYWIMLLGMYFNGYVIICIFIGALIGSFIFQWERLDSRLRRKKCDEARPVCAICGSLEISCYYSDAKPDWMDGGPRERQMADELKLMVKQKASERRDRKWGQLPTMMDLSPSTQAASATAAVAVQQPRQEQVTHHQQPPDHIMTDGDDGPGEGSLSSTALSEPSSRQAASSSNTSPSGPSSPPPPHLPWGVPMQDEDGGMSAEAFQECNRSEREVNFTMIYLDYVVPFLFPFYRPCLFESSRGWMLVLLMKNRALFHTALSLANWLFAVLLGGAGADEAGGDMHVGCKAANWAELQAHQATAIRALHEDVKALDARGVAHAFRECLACMQSVVQLLEFGIAMAGAHNTDGDNNDVESQTGTGTGWQVHHDAAVALFSQVIAHHATPLDRDGAPTTPWASIMDKIGYPFHRIPLGNGKFVLTSDQSAFLFYTAQLLYIDIVAATANAEAPRLRAYHAELLHSDSDDHHPRIRLGEYVGCHSWALAELAAAAELAASWRKKRQTTDASSFDASELAQRASIIETRLRHRMSSLHPHPHPSTTTTTSHARTNIYDPSAHHPALPFSGLPTPPTTLSTTKLTTTDIASRANSPAVNLHTLIWAHATLLYLRIATHGFRPRDDPSIRAGLRAVISLLRSLPSPLALRTLVWPFAVAGCLALSREEKLAEREREQQQQRERRQVNGNTGVEEEEEEEEVEDEQVFFAALVADLGVMRVFGTVGEALRLMRAVWAHRRGGCCDDPLMWDVATCLSVLGHPSLLI